MAVVFRVMDFNLTEPAPTGHVEVRVDGVIAALTDEETVVLPLDSGPHAILLRLIALDGTPLVPDVTDAVSVTVTHGPPTGSPGVQVTYPAEGEDRGPDTAVSFRLTNFALVPPASPVAPNEGHVHVLLDGTLYSDLTEYVPAHFSDLSTGDHTVTLELVDSAHEPLSPQVSDSVHFHVGEGRGLDITFPLEIVAAALAVAVLAVSVLPKRRRPR